MATKMTNVTIKILMFGLMLPLSISIVNLITETNVVGSETGKGKDIMTVFGVENTNGDIVSIITVNNGEASRVKFLETEAFKPVSANLSSLVTTPRSGSEVKTIEYVATFPI